MSVIRRDRPRKLPKAQTSPHKSIDWARVLYRVTEGVFQDLPTWAGDRAALLGAIRARDWLKVLEVTKASPPQLYADAASYYAAAQVENLFKKLPIPGRDVVCRDAAWQTFVGDERKNRRTNQRFRALERRGYDVRRNPLYTRLLSRMQRFVAQALGEKPDLDSVYGFCDYGPGACVGVGGDSTHVFAKLDRTTVGRRALPYLLGAVWSHDQYRRLFSPVGRISQLPRDGFREEFLSHVEYVEHNKIDFVPKNAKTHRLTASEPSGNQWVQLGCGMYMAAALRQFRPFINLNHQERNQLLAYEGSLSDATRPISTIDLRSSSQSLATLMVKGVFAKCPEWFTLMDSLRSHSYTCDLGSGRYELFVSMGNGFCFPLQSLIYSAAIEAVYEECGRKPYYAVFGDDLIVDQDIALLLIEWLRYLGVRTNVDKTFVFGAFRESCGSDFFDGTNVRPYVVDSLPSTGRELVKLANGLRTVAARPLMAAWHAVWDLMPADARSTVVPWKVPLDKGLMVDPEFYDLHKLDKYDHALQRTRVRQYSTRPIQDDSWYGSREHPVGQLFGLLRGVTPRVRQRTVAGRETPITAEGGEPVPYLRRKVKERLEYA